MLTAMKKNSILLSESFFNRTRLIMNLILVISVLALLIDYKFDYIDYDLPIILLLDVIVINLCYFVYVRSKTTILVHPLKEYNFNIDILYIEHFWHFILYLFYTKKILYPYLDIVVVGISIFIVFIASLICIYSVLIIFISIFLSIKILNIFLMRMEVKPKNEKHK